MLGSGRFSGSSADNNRQTLTITEKVTKTATPRWSAGIADGDENRSDHAGEQRD
jgi:hypothetical protein